jgi:hypothetical protein
MLETRMIANRTTGSRVVENRQSDPSEKTVSDELKTVPVKGMEPSEDGVVTRRSVGVVAGFPD